VVIYLLRCGFPASRPRSGLVGSSCCRLQCRTTAPGHVLPFLIAALCPELPVDLAYSKSGSCPLGNWPKERNDFPVPLACTFCFGQHGAFSFFGCLLCIYRIVLLLSIVASVAMGRVLQLICLGMRFPHEDSFSLMRPCDILGFDVLRGHGTGHCG
jgi:hypothetical protein